MTVLPMVLADVPSEPAAQPAAQFSECQLTELIDELFADELDTRFWTPALHGGFILDERRAA